MSESTSVAGPSKPLNVDEAVRNRYERAANTLEKQLCCPVDYDARHLELIPEEIISRDYGCGDPSQHVASGETVLDLGSGAGKICYITAQVVGQRGRVIGIDCNDEMLNLSRKYQDEMARRLGFANVDFRKGKIQDLKLNLEQLDEYLKTHPIENSRDWLRVEEHAQQLRDESPLVSDKSVDVVVSNCVLNLVRLEDRRQLWEEMYRVLNRGGRTVISDIVSDEDVPKHLKRDSQLWSGCISGAFREDRLLKAFEDAGFYGIEILHRQAEPWAIVEGIEFRSMTVQAFKGKNGPCLDRRQAVIYNGPWKTVIDDDGHKLTRGERMAVCDKTFNIYTKTPYADQITAVLPHQLTPLHQAPEFSFEPAAQRSPRETKGEGIVQAVIPDSDCCNPGSGCC